TRSSTSPSTPPGTGTVSARSWSSSRSTRRSLNNLFECRLEERPLVARFITRLHWNLFGLERDAVDITSAALLECVRDHLPAPMIVREVRLRPPTAPPPP